MNTFTKLAGTSILALALTACASTDDKYQVGANDSDQYGNASNPDVELSDAQTFGVDDNDNFEATSSRDMKRGDMKMSNSLMVGGAPMMSNKTIVENASAANNLTTLVSLVKQAELVDTLSSDGPFTVFAPTNDAFSLLPSATVSSLTKAGNEEALGNVLKAHVISGTVTSSDLMAQLTNGRSYSAQTVSGDTLTFYKMGDAIRVADENGTLAKILNADVMQSNGVVHVVNSVLVPK